MCAYPLGITFGEEEGCKGQSFGIELGGVIRDISLVSLG